MFKLTWKDRFKRGGGGGRTGGLGGGGGGGWKGHRILCLKFFLHPTACHYWGSKIRQMVQLAHICMLRYLCADSFSEYLLNSSKVRICSVEVKYVHTYIYMYTHTHTHTHTHTLYTHTHTHTHTHRETHIHTQTHTNTHTTHT